MADRVAVEVNIDTCLRQFATVASSKNSKGNANVAICNPLPVAYKRDARHRPGLERPRRAGRRLRELVGMRVGGSGRCVLGFLWRGPRAGFRPNSLCY